MGISLSWVAVEALSAEEALSRLSLGRTATSCAFPFKGVGCHALTANWFLVVAGRCDHRIASAPSLVALSAGCRAVTCAIEEHVNFASAELWRDGRRIWRVEHQGDEDPENMSSEGQLPQQFHLLLKTVECQDSESLDGHFHMDIPLLLAKEITGFRHDEVNAAFDDAPFEELTDLAAKRRWWNWWS